METHRYIKDGQERIVTGTAEEIAAEKAGIPWQPPAPEAPAPEVPAPEATGGEDTVDEIIG